MAVGFGIKRVALYSSGSDLANPRRTNGVKLGPAISMTVSSERKDAGGVQRTANR